MIELPVEGSGSLGADILTESAVGIGQNFKSYFEYWTTESGRLFVRQSCAQRGLDIV